MVKRLILAAIFLGPLTSSHTAGGAARFVPLGQLPGSENSQAQDISADGSIVVGTHSGAKAFRWTQASGMTYLGDGPNGFDSDYAHAVSGNGEVIVGTYSGQANPFKWTQANGVVPIAPRLTPPGGVSFDGSKIVGGTAHDVSWDGSVVVGAEFSEGYRENNGIRTWLDDLPGGDFGSEANAVSGDGSVVVGASYTIVNEGGQSVGTVLPVRWTDEGGIEALSSWHIGNARDINLGRIVIVGEGSVLKGTGYRRKAFRWTPATGMEAIDEVLLSEGIDMAAMGWELTDAVAVSANGHIIAGWGTNPQRKLEAWLVELPVPGDFNGNGYGDGGDFLAWQSGFGSTYDADDYLDWKANYTLTPRQQAAAAVPESVGMAPIVTAVATVFATFRRRRAVWADSR